MGFDFDEARKWGFNTFGFLAWVFIFVYLASSFVLWDLYPIPGPRLALIFRFFLVASAFMFLLGGLET